MFSIIEYGTPFSVRFTNAGALLSVSEYRTKKVNAVVMFPVAGDTPSFVRTGWSLRMTTATRSRLRAEPIVSWEAAST